MFRLHSSPVTTCGHCGVDLGAHARDIGYSLPDAVWALDGEERDLRAKFDSDTCELDRSRFFIRGIAFVPIVETGEHFGWGFWTEVSQQVFTRYLELYDADARREPTAEGRLANTPQGYPNLDGHPVDIAFGAAEDRPRLTLRPSGHPLFLEQQRGISLARVHELIART
jgi:hypothetical protein